MHSLHLSYERREGEREGNLVIFMRVKAYPKTKEKDVAIIWHTGHV